ncbi:MAG: YfjI family protein [Myxococcales bacterium]|nr:YfjI family protein [Myxococcales bacterium]
MGDRLAATLAEAKLKPVPSGSGNQREPDGKKPSQAPAEGPPAYRLPRFDPAWLPGPLRDFSESLARNLGAPFEMVALKALAVPSLVAGPFVDVEARDGWEEPTTLYVLTIAPSGAKKSPTMKPFTGLLMRAEKARTEALKLAHQSKLAELEEKAAGNSDEASEASEQLKALKKAGTPAPRLWATDVTDERLASLMQENGGHAAVWSAEPKLFRVAGGAYTKGGGPATDVLLQAYSGDQVRVERQMAGSIRVDRPRLTVALESQLKPVQDFLEKTGHDERGELARFLMVSAPDLRGWRVPGPAVPQSHRDAAEECVQSLNRLPNGGLRQVRLTTQAQKRFEMWEREHEAKQRPGGIWREPCGWVSKMPGLVLRLAGVVHMAESVSHEGNIDRDLPLDALERGIAITEWGFVQACEVYRVSQENPVARKLDRLREVLSQSPGILRSELWAKLKNTMGIAATRHLSDLLEELERCGELVREMAPRGKKGGRPGERLYLTPTGSREVLSA